MNDGVAVGTTAAWWMNDCPVNRGSLPEAVGASVSFFSRSAIASGSFRSSLRTADASARAASSASLVPNNCVMEMEDDDDDDELDGADAWTWTSSSSASGAPSRSPRLEPNNCAMEMEEEDDDDELDGADAWTGTSSASGSFSAALAGAACRRGAAVGDALDDVGAGP